MNNSVGICREKYYTFYRNQETFFFITDRKLLTVFLHNFKISAWIYKNIAPLLNTIFSCSWQVMPIWIDLSMNSNLHLHYSHLLNDEIYLAPTVQQVFPTFLTIFFSFSNYY